MQTNVKTHILRLTAVILAASLLCGCCTVKTIKKLKVTACTVESIIPQGLKAAKINLGLGFDNPSSAIDLAGLCATLNCEGVPVLKLTTDEIQIDKKSSKQYSVPVNVQLADGWNLLQAGRLLGSLQNPDDTSKYTIDLGGELKVGKSPKKNLNFKGITVEQLAKALEDSGISESIKLPSWKNLLPL